MATYAPNKLSVLYDEACGFCAECVQWFAQQQASVELEFVPRGSARGRALTMLVISCRQARGVPPEHREDDELLVVDEHGGVYEGPAAFLMCLWALPEYEVWSTRLATPRMLPYARRFFMALSKNRRSLSRLLLLCASPESMRQALPDEPQRCTPASCQTPC
jgi:predicted DCC family thiol-disulfide oxidoreductase YuxK